MQPPAIDPIKERAFRHAEQLLGVGLLMLIVAGCFVILRPFLSVLLWSAILCYATWPGYEWMVRHLKRRNLAALVMTLVLVLLLALPTTLIWRTLAGGVEHLLAVVRRVGVEGLPPLPDWIASIPRFGDYITAAWSEMAQNTEQTTETLKELLMVSRRWLIRNSLHVGQGIAEMCLSVVIAFFFYRDGYQVARRVTDVTNRVMGAYTQHLITVVGSTIRAVVYGVLGTALAQGIVAAIGFRMAGIPAAYFWALLIALLAFLPIGPATVWVTATLWLLLQGSIGWAVFMFFWGFIGISGIDNVVRPMLISRNAKLSFLPVMLGVFGGLLAFGMIGLFLGPTLLAVGMSLAKEFAQSDRQQAAGPVPDSNPPVEREESYISDPN